MELNETKNPRPKAALTGGQKALIILALSAAVLAAAFFAYQNHRETRYRIDRVLSGLFDDVYYADPYDPKEYPDWLEYFNAVRDKRSFQKELAGVFTEMVSVGLNNTEYSWNGEEDSGLRKMKDRFDREWSISTCGDRFNKAIQILVQAGYEDQRLTEAAQTLYTQGKQLILDASDSESGSVQQASRIATRIDDAAERLNAWNEAGGSFYQIDVSSIYSASDIRDQYLLALQGYQEEKNFQQFTRILENIEASCLLAGEKLIDAREIFAFFTGGSYDTVYTTLRRQGGYYDDNARLREIRNSDSSGCYGDFYYTSSSHRRGGKTYDMTEFNNNPGLWNSIGTDLQNYITDANRRANSTVTTVTAYCRGEKFTNSEDIPELVKEGYHYAVPLAEFDGVKSPLVYVSEDSITTGSTTVTGDFTAIYQDLRSRYGAGEAGTSDGGTVIPLSQQLDNPAPALTPYVPFCGTFVSETGKFISDFTLRNGQVYWQASSAWDNGKLPFLFIKDDVTYALLTDPCPVHDMEAVHDYDGQVIQEYSDMLAAEGVANEDGQTVILPQSSDGTEAAKLTFQEDGTIRYDLGYYSRIEEFYNKPSVKSGFVSQYSVVYTREG